MTRLRIGYVPLIDAAPLIIAQELGFAEEEGLSLELVRFGAWAQTRDMLGMGLIDAAHMLVPMPVAQALGLGLDLPAMDLVMFLSHGGQAIGVSRQLESDLRADGHDFAFDDARKAGLALRRVARGHLRIGIPFPFSTHRELTSHWLNACGFQPGEIKLITVPPPLMAQSIASGEIDVFCVGEPWASVSVDQRAASILLPGTAIWSAPPEKGLVLRRDFLESDPDRSGALMRAIWRAGSWLDDPDHRSLAAEIVSRRDYLDLPPDLVERGLSGALVISANGDMRQVPNFVAFSKGGVNFPWRSIAAFLATRLAQRQGLDPQWAAQQAMPHFRTDLYRQHLRQAGAPLPGASLRIEGALPEDRLVAAERGSMILRADSFFDGFTFDPIVINGAAD